MSDPNKEKEEREPCPDQAGKEMVPSLAPDAHVKAEEAAAAMLGEAFADEKKETPEEIGREIAERYQEKIPDGDRKFSSAHVETLLYILNDAYQSSASGPLSTSDMIGNAVLFAVDSKQEIENRMAAFVANPSELAVTAIGNKIGYLWKNSLPKSIRKAIISIAVTEGSFTVVDAMRDLLPHIRDIATEGRQGVHDAQKIASEFRQKNKTNFTEANRVRQRAIIELMKKLYPDVMNSPEFVLVQKIWAQPPASHEKVPYILRLVQEYQELTRETWQFVDRRGNSVSPESLTPNVAMLSYMAMQEALEHKIAEKYGSFS